MRECSNTFEECPLQVAALGDRKPSLTAKPRPRPVASNHVRQLNSRLRKKHAQVVRGMSAQLGGDSGPALSHLTAHVFQHQLLALSVKHNFRACREEREAVLDVANELRSIAAGHRTEALV